MTNDEFQNLKAGNYVIDHVLNVDGHVLYGKWQNWATGQSGEGLYIKWNDGDNSQVGMTLHDEEDIADMIKVPSIT